MPRAHGFQLESRAIESGVSTKTRPGNPFGRCQRRVDQEVLLDAQGGSVVVRDSQLSVSSARGSAGELTLMGESIHIDGQSQLLAQGSDGGGLIQIGGSWQNNDLSVRQATTTRVGPAALINASATERGDGGEIVVWSDILASDSNTDIGGTFLAAGGPQGGDGGRIETSGATLSLAPGLKIDRRLSGKPVCGYKILTTMKSVRPVASSS